MRGKNLSMVIAGLNPSTARWMEMRWNHPNGRAFITKDRGMKALVSVDEINGAEWLHLSVSRKSRCPTYEDLQEAHASFLDPDKPAYQVFPRRDEHRNFHATCLHLWQPLGPDPFPDPLLERANTIGPPAELEAEARAYAEQLRRGGGMD